MKTRSLLIINLLALIFSITLAVTTQEIITLTTPETKPSNTSYHVEKLGLDVDDGRLWISLKGVTGEIVTCTYSPTTNPTGATLITGLNKANLSTAYAGNATTGSLRQRIHHRLIAMGESAAVCSKTLTGTLTGNPQ